MNIQFSRLLAVAATLMAAVSIHAAAPQLDPGGLEFGFPDQARNKALVRRQWSVICRPMQMLDGKYCLSEQGLSVLVFVMANPQNAKPADPHLMLKLPASVTPISFCPSFSKVTPGPETNGIVTFDCKLPATPQAYSSEDGVSMYGSLAIMVRADAPAGAGLPDLECWFRDGQSNGPVSALKLAVLPEIRAQQPKTLLVGPMLGKPTGFMKGDEVKKSYGAFLKQCGLGCVVGGRGTDSLKACLEAGLLAYTESGLANGFMLQGKHPDEVAFILSNGKPFKGALCPTAIAAGHPYVETNLYENQIRKYIVTDRCADDLTTNWEPYMFLGKGCFCERCRDEFIAWSKLPADEIKRDWPLKMMVRHKKTWEKFFAYQHGRVVVKCEEYCQRAGKEVGRDSHFVPQLACTVAYRDLKDEYYHRMTEIDEYRDKLGILQFWGGYSTWAMVNTREPPADSHVLAYDMLRKVVNYFPDRKPGGRPVLCWGSSGLMVSLVDFPEVIRFNVLSALVSGMDQIWLYRFPVGYDNRYWQALADGAATAAQVEQFTGQGKRAETNAFAVTPVSPLPACESGAPLRQAGFEKDGSFLAAVGNGWLEGECFFKLALPGLKPDDLYVITRVPGDLTFAGPAEKSAWSGADLAKGALLHAGGIRWAFYVVAPAGRAKPSKNVITPAEVEAEMKARQAQLAAAAGKTNQKIAKARKLTEGDKVDYSGLKELSAGTLTCTIRNNADDQTPELVYQKAGEEIVVAPAKGARIVSWMLGDYEVVLPLGPHHLAVDATWDPAAFVDGNAQVLAHEVVPEGIRLRTSFTFTEKARGCLPGLKVERELTIPEKESGFRARVILTNTTKEKQAFAYRMTGTVRMLANLEGQKAGWMQLWNAKGPFRFDRNYMKNEFSLAGRTPAQKIAGYGMDGVREITEPKILFGTADESVQVEASMAPDKFFKFVNWDSGGQEVGTAEFISVPITLAPGESWETAFAWRRVEGGKK